MRKASRSRDGGQEHVEWDVSAVESRPYVEVGQVVVIRGEERRITAIESVVMRYWKDRKAGLLRRKWRANIATSTLALALLVSGCMEPELEPGLLVNDVGEDVGHGLAADGGRAPEDTLEEAPGDPLDSIVHPTRSRIELTISTTSSLKPDTDVELITALGTAALAAAVATASCAPCNAEMGWPLGEMPDLDMLVGDTVRTSLLDHFSLAKCLEGYGDEIWLVQADPAVAVSVSDHVLTTVALAVADSVPVEVWSTETYDGNLPVTRHPSQVHEFVVRVADR